jgi:hypothetical protein
MHRASSLQRGKQHRLFVAQNVPARKGRAEKSGDVAVQIVELYHHRVQLPLLGVQEAVAAPQQGAKLYLLRLTLKNKTGLH